MNLPQMGEELPIPSLDSAIIEEYANLTKDRKGSRNR